MHSLDDTIAAIGTPIGIGGIGIVRMSGPEAPSILRRLFRPARGDDSAWHPEPRRLTYGHIVDPENGQPVDEVLVAYMPAPHTYTRQDVVEINGHGGPMPLRRILELCLRYGARLAEPGEFTLRAFVHGRIDLAQAEAVRDVILARTEAALRVATAQLDGHLSTEVQRVRGQLVDVLAWLEASIDFAEDEIPSRDIGPDLEVIHQELEELLRGAERGLVYRQGVRAAIVGRPNVGKSSLLNRLLRTSRAIVTPVPGTTRDTLEETLNLQGIPLVLVDTAGITEHTDDVVEQLGIARSRQALAQADLALLVVDGSEPLTEADRDIAALIGDKPALLVINKCDLPPAWEDGDLLPGARRVRISALTGEGLPELEQSIVDMIFAGQVWTSDLPLVSNPRHRALLAQARDQVAAAQDTLQQGLPADFISIHVTAAVQALGEITGETVSEDLLDSIFSQFCIGK